MSERLSACGDYLVGLGRGLHRQVRGVSGVSAGFLWVSMCAGALASAVHLHTLWGVNLGLCVCLGTPVYVQVVLLHPPFEC